MKPSTIIDEFLSLLDKSHQEYNKSKSVAEYYNGKTFDNIHTLEDCPDEQLFEFAKKWRQETWDRRVERDNMALWENIHKFASSESNRPFLKRLKGLSTEQKKTENFLETPPQEREFKGGVKGGDANGTT